MKQKTTKILIAVVALVIVVAAVAALWLRFSPKPQAGDKTITLSVVYQDESQEDYTIQTDAEYLKEAIEDTVELGGEESEYGFTLYTVNGVTADFNTSGDYWAIYVNGEYGQYALDAQPVADGDSFSLVYESFS